MPTWRIDSAASTQWATGTAYGLGARVVCRSTYATVARRMYVYECTTAGTSHAATEPTWPTSGTVADNDVVWTTRTPNDGVWANASCILHYVLNHASPAGGDIILIDDGHNEVSGIGGNYIILGGTSPASPIYLYSVDKADDSLSVGAIVSVPSNAIRFSNYTYSYGIKYKSVAVSIAMYTGGHIIESDGSAVLELTNSGIGIVATGYPLTILNGSITFGNAGNFISTASPPFKWYGGSLLGTSPTKLFDSSLGIVDIRNVNLSNLGNNILADVGETAFQNLMFTRCKFPETYTLTAGTHPVQQGGIRLYHCSSSNINYDLKDSSYYGLVSHETTIIRTSGASNGTTGFSMKMVSSANTLTNVQGLVSPDIHGWTGSTTEKTFTVQGVYDSATNLQDDEIWMEFEYPINNTDGLGAFLRDKCDTLGTPADKTTSTVDWTTTGITNVNKFKFTFTVTPGKAGPITARICLAKPSTTVYIDPMIVES